MTEPQADSFGSLATGLREVDPVTGLAYQIGIGPDDPDGNPTAIWILISTWGEAKALLGGSWAEAKRRAPTWGAAKAIVATA